MMDFHSVVGRVAAATLLALVFSVGCGGGSNSRPDGDAGSMKDARDGGDVSSERPAGDGSPDATCEVPPTKRAAGAACECDGQCASNFCTPEGVCCNEACKGGCETCTASGKVGTCVALAAGAAPRVAGACQSTPASSCGPDGTCDGAGECRRHPAGTPCRQGSCDGDAVVGSYACNGAGQCRPGATVICAPYACDSTSGKCHTKCSSNGMCVSGRLCKDESCGKLPNGAACMEAVQCESGFCADGVCCNRACTGACVSCSLPGHQGRCWPIDNGLPDPHGVCTDQGATSCGRNGTCDGLGGCALYPRDTQCLAPSCSGNQLNTAGTCDGLGTCREPGVQTCDPFRCVNGACTDRCTTNADCKPGIACLNNTCGPKLPGQACAASSECLPNHHCVDGVCCESACTGPCRSCALPSAMGRCTTIAPGNPDPRSVCKDEGASTCGTNGRCDGTGGCQKYPVGTECRGESCVSNVYTPASTCNATGQCEAPDSLPCRPYVCNGSRCFDTCAADAQCLSPNTCRMNSCGLKDRGAACTLGNECLSGFCAQGVCCDNACTGACRSCALTGSMGTCTVVANGTVDPSGMCTAQAAASCGRNGRCMAGACQLHVSGTPCADSTCPAGTTMFTAGSTCNGSGMCVTPTPSSCFPYRCGTGVCRGACTSDADCASPAVCTDGSCGLKAKGVACGGDNECLSGHCEQGFCCETACTGTCKSCALASSRGTCSNVANGDPDPQGGCADMGAASCSTDGFCNGNGACRLYAAGTACVAPSCPAGQSTLISGRTCNGAGVCQAATSIACAPYVCNGTTACRAACTGDGDCLPPNICDPETNLCGNKKRLGQACAATAECLTGNTCVDGVCCSATACGRCQACNVPGSAGNCANVPSGTLEPHGLCAPNPPCGNTGACNGAGACQLASTSTACGTQTCTGSTFTPISNCNGMGACAAPTASSCSPYVCGTNACRTTCAADADCMAPFTCQGTAPNRSCALKPNGQACTAGNQCISGACVNGVCCGSPSCGTCQSCNVAGSPGTCTNLPAGTPAPAGQCAAAPPCGNTGTCNGAGACSQSSSATQCSGASCSGSTLVQAAFCSGTGGTCPAATSVSCSPYVCGSTTACRTSCTADAHCISSGFYCNVAGSCVPKKNPGQACSANNECGTGFCVDGVCCNTGSCGLCQSCNVGATAGTCTNLPAGTTAPAGQCAAAPPCGNTGTCNGAGACTVTASSVQCRAASCTGSTLTQAASCTGSGGTCPTETTVSCAPYVCGTGACKTSCASNEDCANTVTHYCTGPGGSCAAKQANGTVCTSGNQCSSGNCVDGVCCGSPSCGLCQACNLAGSVGTCANVGAGAAEPHGLCPAQAPSTCGNTGACTATGTCAKHGTSVMCGAASCTGSTFTPASFCSGSGTCQPATPSACPGGFICSGGVCRTTCSSNADCADPATYCTGANGQCLPRQGNGSACSSGNQCTSGNCVDNVCCSAPACSTCQACNVTGSAGTCTTVPNGTPEPHGLCAASPPCGNTGVCSGGACQQTSSSVVCADATCVGNTHHAAASCTGAGTCSTPVTDDCTPYRCAASGCPASCNSDADCINSTYYCSGPGGSCLTKRANAAVCVSDNQCASGNCTDGVCCASPSCASCQSCNVSGSAGMCANVPAGTPDPAGVCVAQGANTCGTNGLCNGSGNCAVYDGDTVCASSCALDGAFYNVSFCDGMGACGLSVPMPCVSLMCVEGSGCVGS